ncbi:hypothetical protein [Kineosporia sp. NBRC 101731]|uniref:hypothetical protein n=1 Tax=Kineosporia sp. NBRC 101731 TaxID=3032199 RepID=UPI0024A0A29C|nr:hypothetical protein [Kineosporia sp. NBRC 101731]GLY32534.1 hypothetical protein Kisp02_58990 [Kineosporia sp. NBRC 101731]
MVEAPLPWKQPRVLIAPSYGDPAVRKRWHDTMEAPISFTAARISQHLDAGELDQLRQHHPDSTARLWGAKPRFDAAIDQLSTGDLVLFTGQSRLRAIGTFGFKTRNERLADELWPPAPGEAGWTNVYSVTDLLPVQGISYPELATYLGYGEKYPFQGTLLVSAEQASRVIANLGIEVHGSQDVEESADVAALLPVYGRIPLERMHVSESAYDQHARTISIHRVEALLVQRYAASRPDQAIERIRTETGYTDLYVPAEKDLIEAKRGAGHGFVREALAQLLDYSTHTDVPIDRLTALFPSRPADRGIQLLNRFGIDCLYYDAPEDRFTRVPTSAEAFKAVRTL